MRGVYRQYDCFFQFKKDETICKDINILKLSVILYDLFSNIWFNPLLFFSKVLEIRLEYPYGKVVVKNLNFKQWKNVIIDV